MEQHKPEEERGQREGDDQMEFIAQHNLEDHGTHQPQAKQASEYGTPSTSSEPSTKKGSQRKRKDNDT